MRTKFKDYVRSVGFSMDAASCRKIDKLQNQYLLDRSSILRIITHQMTMKQFDDMFNAERGAEIPKVLVKRKIMDINFASPTAVTHKKTTNKKKKK